MGEILGLGLTHYPGLMVPDEAMVAGQRLRVPVPARSACGGPRYDLSSARVWSR